MSLWRAWKRQWRRFEKSTPICLAKRRVRQLYGAELRHFREIRRPTARYGEWCVSVTDSMTGGIAYSFGVGEDAILDLALIEHYGFEVHGFDPTPRARAWVARQELPRAFHFHSVGVAGHDGTAEFRASKHPRNPSYKMVSTGASENRVCCPVRKLTTISQELGHERIDLLKIDIEGAEYEVIDDLVTSNLRIKQILIEFHHRFEGIGLERTARAVMQLQRAGYRIFSISARGQEYSFIGESERCRV